MTNCSTAPTTRLWSPRRPVDLEATLGTLARGAADPCFRRSADGAVWRATRTPHGPVLLRLACRAADSVQAQVEAHAWGPGADWVLDGVPQLLGEHDVPTGFAPLPAHELLVRGWRARPGWRVPRTRAVFEALVPAALEQRVTGVQARASYAQLVRQFGQIAPGPAQTPGTAAFRMRVPPSPEQWSAIPSWQWLQAGVDLARRRVVLAAAQVAGRLEATVDLPGAQAAVQLRLLPGVGVWTAAEVRQRAHGDGDAFSWSDYHVAKNVSWALTGQVLDDVGCAEVIECYRGHRYRVQRLLELAGAKRPRRGPRLTLPTHLPVVLPRGS